MAVRFQFVPGREPAGLLTLPWRVRLAEWPDELLVRMAHGVSRHVVRFVRDEAMVYALKEMPEDDARHEYRMLRLLAQEGLPAVEAVGLVTGRPTDGEEPLDAVLVTRYLDYSLPYRYLLGVDAGHGLAASLVDAAVVLLVRLHLEGFYWGDCSLSNLLFRRDAGALMAYLVDAETAEHRPSISGGLRSDDLTLAAEHVSGGLLDLQAAGRLEPHLDPFEVGELLVERYDQLWDELTGVTELHADDQHLVEARIRRLNELGFDVEELEVEQDTADARLRIRPALVEEGHHARELRRLTDLRVQENQARRLLNDVAAYGAHLSHVEGRSLPLAVAAARWFVDVYEPIVAAVPAELTDRREPAELFHEFLEHRYYLAEKHGRDIDSEEALRSYLETVLAARPGERIVVDGPD